jgi:hypothetical protein
MVNKAIGETTVIDIFTALFGIASVCVMVRAITNIIFRQPKVWDEDWAHEEIEELTDYNEIRKQNPHIWIE